MHRLSGKRKPGPVYMGPAYWHVRWALHMIPFRK